ncbi:butyrate kinase [Halothermothrix orenii]|uniref:Probable butyrate kinase n=1 Tax=Halothermothrix orenii (strain H 168 / OCM 544 / DSM 9562) TaxID=373903 RepID=B8D0J7_HALOH|nr:butyrate kinase [Halothermothrix orenii]ACL70933.1 Butyrate kinase [Halothermothrix orenii H 168]
MNTKILVINPGSTSTKIAVFDKIEELWATTIDHKPDELSRFKKIIDQLEWRQELIQKELKEAGFLINDFGAIAARGGLLDPIPGGTYIVDSLMVDHLYEGKNGEHASNLAGIIAYRLGQEYNVPAYTVDPVAVDEFIDESRFSGMPELKRRCQSHALNLKAIARRVAEDLGKDLNTINLIGVHLGGGISVAAIKGGRIIDVNNANQEGPYSPERVGSLPSLELVNYIYKNKPPYHELKKKLLGQGGLSAYTGTNDGREIEKRIKSGDREAKLAYDGMIYQIAKEIGKMATVFRGKVAAVYLTGGLAYSEYVVQGIKERVSFIAPVMVYPGAEEMKHLAAGVTRVLLGEESPRDYDKTRL